jgi:hypothetical protein
MYCEECGGECRTVGEVGGSLRHRMDGKSDGRSRFVGWMAEDGI